LPRLGPFIALQVICGQKQIELDFVLRMTTGKWLMD